MIHRFETREALDEALSPMGLRSSDFERAVQAGVAESRGYSLGAPKAASNAARWFRTVEVLHTSLMAKQGGWTRVDPENLPCFVRGDGRMALIVSSGDEATGDPFESPTNKNRKGAAVSQKVEINGQRTLFDDPSPLENLPPIAQTWVFLYHEADGVVRLELSLPVAMSGGTISEWQERIIFPDFDVDRSALVFEHFDDGDDDYNFVVARR